MPLPQRQITPSNTNNIKPSTPRNQSRQTPSQLLATIITLTVLTITLLQQPCVNFMTQVLTKMSQTVGISDRHVSIIRYGYYSKKGYYNSDETNYYYDPVIEQDSLTSSLNNAPIINKDSKKSCNTIYNKLQHSKAFAHIAGSSPRLRRRLLSSSPSSSRVFRRNHDEEDVDFIYERVGVVVGRSYSTTDTLPDESSNNRFLTTVGVVSL